MKKKFNQEGRNIPLVSPMDFNWVAEHETYKLHHWPKSCTFKQGIPLFSSQKEDMKVQVGLESSSSYYGENWMPHQSQRSLLCREIQVKIYFRAHEHEHACCFQSVWFVLHNLRIYLILPIPTNI